MKIEGILKSCFWILLHQGMFSLICSRIQGHMLSLMIEVDPFVTSVACLVWDAKSVFPIDWEETRNKKAKNKSLCQTQKVKCW